MKIVVCVKQVPDTWAEKKLDPETKTLDRGAADSILNEMDEFAVEESLRLTEAHGGEVTVLSMGPEDATDAIRKALSMGADNAVHVVDEALQGSDSPGTSLVLTAALRHIGDYELVLCGSESSDARTSVVPAMLAERLGLPQLTFADNVEVDPEASSVRIKRLTEDGYEVVEATMPAVISVVENMNEPRYPSFKGIMSAKKKPVETLTIAELGVEAAQVGTAGAWTSVESFAHRPPRSAGEVVTDDGDGGTKLVEFLAANKFA